MDYKVLIVCMICWKAYVAEKPASPPELFGKDEKPDKLVIKNQIAYHFKKVVREVNQELFVSRRIDVSLLFAGIQVLKKTEAEVRRLCVNLPAHAPSEANAPRLISETKVVHVDQSGSPINKEPFTLISNPPYSSYKEAKARCQALGMQLPEIYDNNRLNALTEFMKLNSVALCFAGIEPDLSDSIPRHVSTQYPIWKTAYTKFRSCGTGQDLDIGWSIDDGHAKFMYNVNESICVSHDFEHNPISLKLYADHTNREQYKILTQLMGRVICTPKWDGRTDINIPTDNLKTGGLAVKNRFTRGTFLGRNRAKLKVKHIRRSVNNDPSSDMKNVQTLCFGVADHANESYQDIQSKLVDLLALVDITVHSEIINNNRQKRVPLFLAKFIFVTGVKLLWQLFGFVQKVKMNKRLKNIESMLKVIDSRSLQNSDAIANMTNLIASNAFAISQLSIRVDGLEARLSLVESQVYKLQQGLNSLTYKFETVTALMTIDNLIARTRRSMESGYEILKEIIHSTKLKQTSPLILPLDQIELVQNEISKVSTAVIDPDFSKMQSIVVSDPADPTKLLVVVNVAALGRRNLELVRMIPVPYFESGTAYEIILDYHTIVLDQNAHTFSILTEQEEYDCLFNRCYVGSSEQSYFEKSCGIPQFYDRHNDGCVAENVMSNGVYLKPMLPDGVIFAFQHQVQTQVFCKDKLMSKSQKLNGTGIFQLPNGCTLSVIDSNGRITRIKGQPQYTMINAGDIDLMPNGPLSAIQADVSGNSTKKAASINAFVESRVSSVIKQVELVDGKISGQHTHVWALTGTIFMFLFVIMLVIYLLYRYSTRARRKIQHVRDNFNELSRKIFEPESDNPVPQDLLGAEGGDIFNPPPHRKRDKWLAHLREGRQKAHLARMHFHSIHHGKEQPSETELTERTYVSMSDADEREIEERYIARPLSRPSTFKPLGEIYNREYPRIPTPSVRDTQEGELVRLREETDLSDQLSISLSPSISRKNVS